MDVLRTVALLAATLTTGLMAGVFSVYAVAVMPGLGRADDRTFVAAFQAIDRAIINPVFLATFLGALLTTGAAAGLHLGEEEGSVLAWAAGAFSLYLAAVVVTLRVHVPLNDEIKAAGDPATMPDPGAVRRRLEARWVRWNGIRTVLTVAAFGCLAWALVEHGRM